MLIFALTGLIEVSRQKPLDERRLRSELYLNKVGLGVRDWITFTVVSVANANKPRMLLYYIYLL